MAARTPVWDPDALIARRLELNRDRWAAVQSDTSAPRNATLLFTYAASALEKADELAGFLRAATDYDVCSSDNAVEGTTNAAVLSLELLDDWVSWMVLVGYAHGRCRFEGWRVAV